MSCVSVSFDGREPADAVFAKADAAVASGVDRVWLACHLFQRDPIATAGVLLGRYPDLEIVLMAISPYLMHPVHAAMAAATLDEFFPGRVSLCLGVGAPADMASVGVETPKPLATMREALEICRTLFGGETVTVDGERFRVAGRALGSGPCAVPLLLAASGPKMLRLAGGHADGVALSAAASAEYVCWSLDRVAEGNPPYNFRRCGLVYASVDADGTAARDRVRRVLATVLRGTHHARNLELAGSRLDQAALNAAFEAGDLDAVDVLIDDAIVAHHAAAGTAEAFRARIAAYRAAGLDEVVLASMRTPEQLAAVAAALDSSS